jgi:hypothetical protein
VQLWPCPPSGLAMPIRSDTSTGGWQQRFKPATVPMETPHGLLAVPRFSAIRRTSPRPSPAPRCASSSDFPGPHNELIWKCVA